MKTLKIGRSKLIKYSLLLGSIFLFAITFPPLSTDVSAAKLTESNCESSGGEEMFLLESVPLLMAMVTQ